VSQTQPRRNLRWRGQPTAVNSSTYRPRRPDASFPLRLCTNNETTGRARLRVTTRALFAGRKMIALSAPAKRFVSSILIRKGPQRSEAHLNGRRSALTGRFVWSPTANGCLHAVGRQVVQERLCGRGLARRKPCDQFPGNVGSNTVSWSPDGTFGVRHGTAHRDDATRAGRVASAHAKIPRGSVPHLLQERKPKTPLRQPADI